MVGLSKTTQGDLIQRRQEKLQVSDWNNKHLNVTEVNRDQETLYRLKRIRAFPTHAPRRVSGTV
jgi:macrodomain Ter protein organizer (MatP/YcbG family)